MEWNLLFFLNSIFLGIGLAMDAFSVSVAHGLSEPRMKTGRVCLIAGIFALFQGVMPMLGYTCVHTILTLFERFQVLIPWIALILLAAIGIKMIVEGLRGQEAETETEQTGFKKLLILGVATSIDALSVGFTIADYSILMAFVCALIICTVTFLICYGGVHFGKKLGTKFTGKAQILGGIILILIGLEIFIKGIFF